MQVCKKNCWPTVIKTSIEENSCYHFNLLLLLIRILKKLLNLEYFILPVGYVKVLFQMCRYSKPTEKCEKFIVK